MSYFDYTEVNGIFYPNLVLPGADYKIGVWGERYRAYIKNTPQSVLYLAQDAVSIR